jgi:hypothetical protein
MKKIFLCTLLFIFSIGLHAQFSGSGSGTSNDPYLISNGDELNQIRFFLNNPDVSFKIVNDIDLKNWIEDNNPTQGWVPIGSSATNRFMGILEGNNYTIKNFLVNRPTTNYVGLFGYAENATFRNIKLIDGYVKGLQYVGALIGYFTNTDIINNSSNIDVTGLASEIGGLIGSANDSKNISENTFSGNVIGITNAGGIVGYVLNVDNISSNNVEKNIAGTNNVGGISGYIGISSTGGVNHTCQIINNHVCNATGNTNVGGLTGYLYIYSYTNKSTVSSSTINLSKNQVSGSIYGADNIGGIAGSLLAITHTDGYRTSANTVGITENFVTGIFSGSNNIAGIVGYIENKNVVFGNQYEPQNKFSLSNNYSTGFIKGINNVGSVVGQIYNHSEGNILHASSSNYIISNNYSGVKFSSIDTYIGGIVGKAINTYINNNVAINNTLAGKSNVNRICGGSESIPGFSNNIAWVKSVVLENSEVKEIIEDDLNGLNYGLSSLKLKSTYQGLGFDFINTWNISNTESFPYFIWQTPPAEFTNKPFKAGVVTVSGKSITGASITLKVNDISYTTIASGNVWSIAVPKLKVNDTLSVTAKYSDKWSSYQVDEIVQLDGDGSLTNPYKIYTEDDLKSISDFGANYILMNDIALSNAWVPIGTAANSLRGSFNGNDHIISNLNVTADVAALFYLTASTASIKRLQVKVSPTKPVSGKSYTAGIVAINNGIIDSCSFIGNLTNTTLSGNIGGVAAVNFGKIYHSFSLGNKISSTANSYIGGIAGYNYGAIGQAYSVGNLNISGATSFVGGLAGYNKGVVENAYASGSFSSSGASNYVGGLIGYNEGDILNTYASGNVTATGASSYSGGLVAYNKKKIEISYSNVNAGSYYRASGVVGYNDGTSASTINCVALGRSVSGNNSINRIVGGFANSAPNPLVTDNYANKDMIVTVNGNIISITDNFMQGTGKSLDQLRLQSNYSALSFDFTAIWHIEESVTFPYLFNIQSAPPEIIAPVYSGSSVAITGSHIENGSSVKVWTNKNSSAKYNTVVNGKWSVVLDILNPTDSIFVTASTGSKGESFVINTIAVASTYTISASANPNIGGSITGVKTYNRGETATLNAISNVGYKFVDWSLDGTSVSTNPTYSFMVNANMSLVANFILNTGIEDQLQTDIRIYPNPVKDLLNIEDPEANVISVSVFDYFGRQLIITREKTINISHLKPGIYLVKVNDEMFKVFKQ